MLSSHSVDGPDTRRCCHFNGPAWRAQDRASCLVCGGYALVFGWMIPMFLLIDTGSDFHSGLAVFVLAIGLGLSYWPQSAMCA